MSNTKTFDLKTESYVGSGGSEVISPTTLLVRLYKRHEKTNELYLSGTINLLRPVAMEVEDEIRFGDQVITPMSLEKRRLVNVSVQRDGNLYRVIDNNAMTEEVAHMVELVVDDIVKLWTPKTIFTVSETTD